MRLYNSSDGGSQYYIVGTILPIKVYFEVDDSGGFRLKAYSKDNTVVLTADLASDRDFDEVIKHVASCIRKINHRWLSWIA